MQFLKLLLSILLLLILANLKVTASQNSNRLTLKIKLNKNITDLGNVTIEFYTHYSRDMDGLTCVSQKVTPKNNEFTYRSPDFRGIAYIKIKVDNGNYFYLSQEIYPVLEGDELILTIDSTTYSFSGPGSPKYNFISKSSEIRPLLDKPFVDIDKSMMDYILSKFESTYYEKRKMLYSIPHISDKERKMLDFNLRCREALDYNDNIARQISTTTEDLIKNVYKTSVQSANVQLLSQLTDSSLMEICPYYYDYIFRYLQNNQSVIHPTSINAAFKWNFPLLFETIQTNYTGQPKYELLLRSLTDFIAKDSTDYYLDVALNEIPTTNYCYKVLANIKNKIGKNAEIPDFELTDTSGNKFHLKQLKGKVVILDFWFTGCTGCKHLAMAMEAVHKRFDNNPNVSFVSICVDKKLADWKRSVISGIYSRNSIDLYTNGQAIEHPLIKFYGFDSFPQLMLIGKNGRIFYADPPRPSRPAATERFIEIVNTAI